ncbi:MAG: hypothetical protein WBO53_20005, partial [Thermoanaerobaculia bacterium]
QIWERPQELESPDFKGFAGKLLIRPAGDSRRSGGSERTRWKGMHGQREKSGDPEGARPARGSPAGRVGVSREVVREWG